MDDDKEDKKHQASSKRLIELRKKGTVMRSRDLFGGLVLVVTVVTISSLGPMMAEILHDELIVAFKSISNILVENHLIEHSIHNVLKNMFIILLPVFGLVIFSLLMAPFFFGGWNFSMESVHFNLQKLNVVSNLSNIFNLKRAGGEVLKSIAKASIILGILVFFFYSKRNELIGLMYDSSSHIYSHIFDLFKAFFWQVMLAVIIIVSIDIALQYYLFQDKVKMSTQELKDESKDANGNQQTKNRIRSAQFSLMKQKIMQVVPKATVVVTNPTHYAVAIRYDETKSKAPIVVAKGKGLLAQKIKMLAISHGVAIYEAPPLSRALYHTSKLNTEIHPELYMSVAIVLSYVHQLKSYQFGVGGMPKFVSEFDLPQEFIFNE